MSKRKAEHPATPEAEPLAHSVVKAEGCVEMAGIASKDADKNRALAVCDLDPKSKAFKRISKCYALVVTSAAAVAEATDLCVFFAQAGDSSSAAEAASVALDASGLCIKATLQTHVLCFESKAVAPACWGAGGAGKAKPEPKPEAEPSSDS